jgi:hypothetical protein
MSILIKYKSSYTSLNFVLLVNVKILQFVELNERDLYYGIIKLEHAREIKSVGCYCSIRAYVHFLCTYPNQGKILTLTKRTKFKLV